jgi:hypothetical protein
MKLPRRWARDLRRYQQLRVIVTLTDGVGMNGFLAGVFRDHVALVDAYGIVAKGDGTIEREPASPGPHVVLKSRIVRLQVVDS